MKGAALISAILFFSAVTQGQSLAINTDGSAANASAMLDVKSTTKGMLVPRMDKLQRKGIALPAAGLLVYQNAPDSTGFYYYNGTNWKWLSNPEAETPWSINGNTGTNPAVNYLGTTDATDLAFRIGALERMRLTTEAELGISENDPKYTLDVKTGYAAINNCINNGLRIKNPSALSNCETGLLFGYPTTLNEENNALIWNYGNSNVNPKNILFGLGLFERMRLTGDGLLGIGTTIPKYTLDIFTGSAGVHPCTRDGIRIKPPDGQTNCDMGLFLGFSNLSESNKISVWDFTLNATATNQYIRFGFGSDDSEGPFSFGESVRILPPGQGVGFGTPSPLAMIHIRNNTGGGAMPGLMVTNPSVPSGNNGFYMGLQLTGAANDAYVWNYQNAPIRFATNNIEQVIIADNGNVGIGTNNPTQKLHVIGNILASGTITPSDSRFKKDITPIVSPLEKLQQLTGVTYHMNTTAFPEWKFEDGKQYGLIAQDVEKVFPEMVKTINAQGYKGVDYVKLIPVLIESIKQQQQQIEGQQNQIDQQQKIIEQLLKKVQ